MVFPTLNAAAEDGEDEIEKASDEDLSSNKGARSVIQERKLWKLKEVVCLVIVRRLN